MKIVNETNFITYKEILGEKNQRTFIYVIKANTGGTPRNNDYYLLNVYSIRGTILNALRGLSHLLPTTGFQIEVHDHLHYTDKGTET